MKTNQKIRLNILLLFVLQISVVSILEAQHNNHAPMPAEKPQTENDFYKLQTIRPPEGVLLEVGGMAMLPDGRLAVCTRRGEIWLVENPSGPRPWFKLFASGLHEPLGLAWKDGALYTAQRAELTRIVDVDGDDRADGFETVCTWPLTGNYCEYNHGPVIGRDGYFYINLNLADNGMSNREPFFGEMGSHSDWRGWMIRVSPDGKLEPYAAGLRSPAGIGLNADGDIFYAENQGGWVGTGYITHVEKGDFFGHPSSLKSAGKPGATVHLKPSDIPTNEPMLHEAVKKVPGMKLPSVRFPHGILGISTSSIIADTSGAFGPFFKDQVFVGDEGHPKIFRVFLEKINGEYQGAVFPFREGFMSGILRTEWGMDKSLYVGMSDRGWHSTGPERWGLQRLLWTGETPFEIRAVKAMPDGFVLEFTLPVKKETAENPDSYEISGFDYLYHMTYGSEVQDKKNCSIKAIKVASDGLSARLVLDGLREGYIHEIKCAGILSEKGSPLLHNFGYYSLNSIPKGAGLHLKQEGVMLIPEKKATVTNNSIVEKAGASKGAVAPAKHVTKMPASWSNGPDRTLTLGTEPGLKFDVEQFTIRPGEKIRLVFNNNDDMQHNWLLVSPGAADEIGKAALDLGLKGANMQYIPVSGKVLYHTSLLQPRSKEAIYFTAPEKEGKYPYICTYPGHYLVMRGILNVKK